MFTYVGGGFAESWGAGTISPQPTASYSQALVRGRLGKVWAAVTGRPRSLLSLCEVSATCATNGRRHAGVRTVPLEMIRGSESRCSDFDCDFNPIQDHTADRWRSIARARQLGRPLPPVELIQVGDAYFVRDGHHRISVARALGQRAIEAEVRVWDVAGAPPWESQKAVKDSTGRGTSARALPQAA